MGDEQREAEARRLAEKWCAEGRWQLEIAEDPKWLRRFLAGSIAIQLAPILAERDEAVGLCVRLEESCGEEQAVLELRIAALEATVRTYREGETLPMKRRRNPWDYESPQWLHDGGGMLAKALWERAGFRRVPEGEE